MQSTRLSRYMQILQILHRQKIQNPSSGLFLNWVNGCFYMQGSRQLFIDQNISNHEGSNVFMSYQHKHTHIYSI